MQPNPRRVLGVLLVALLVSLDWTHVVDHLQAVLQGLKRNRWLAQGPSSIAATILGLETHQQMKRHHPEAPEAASKKYRLPTEEESSSQQVVSRNAFRAHVMQILKTSCLPKLICELHASASSSLSNAEKSLLKLLRDTSIGTVAEVTSRYHFAAHMGQLVAGVEGTGCHNFYPNCPLGGRQVLDLLSPLKLR